MDEHYQRDEAFEQLDNQIAQEWQNAYNSFLYTDLQERLLSIEQQYKYWEEIINLEELLTIIAQFTPDQLQKHRNTIVSRLQEELFEVPSLPLYKLHCMKFAGDPKKNPRMIRDKLKNNVTNFIKNCRTLTCEETLDEIEPAHSSEALKMS